MQILSAHLLESYREKIDFSLLDSMNTNADEEISFDYFDFYSSESSVYSSKIEGETIEADSYFKYKLLHVDFQGDLTKKIDDLFNAYSFIKSNAFTFENVINAHELLSGNFLPKSQQGKIRTNLIYVFNEKSQIEYFAATPETVEAELEKLFSDIDFLLNKNLSAEEVFFYASQIHLVFVKIHPFNDGNGRAARLLEKWFLISKFGENAFSVPLERNYYQNLQQYYSNIKKLGLEYDELDYSKALDFLLMTPFSLKND